MLGPSALRLHNCPPPAPVPVESREGKGDFVILVYRDRGATGEVRDSFYSSTGQFMTDRARVPGFSSCGEAADESDRLGGYLALDRKAIAIRR